jgi:hypothetical protein
MVIVNDVINVLQQCVDPELGANIVDIGLIYNIRIKDDKDVKLTLTMTSPMCPVTSIIMADAQLRIEWDRQGGVGACMGPPMEPGHDERRIEVYNLKPLTPLFYSIAFLCAGAINP